MLTRSKPSTEFLLLCYRVITEDARGRQIACESFQIMCKGAVSKVGVSNGYSNECKVQVGVHQTIIEEYKTGCLWELQYADDIILILESGIRILKSYSWWEAKSRVKEP